MQVKIALMTVRLLIIRFNLIKFIHFIYPRRTFRFDSSVTLVTKQTRQPQPVKFGPRHHLATGRMKGPIGTLKDTNELTSHPGTDFTYNQEM